MRESGRGSHDSCGRFRVRAADKGGIFMSLIRVTDLSFTYEGSSDPVFESASFLIDTDWKLGFTGRNGRGKTTFLKLLEGEYEYQGRIEASVEFDYFPFPVGDGNKDVLEVVLEKMPDIEFWQLKRELKLLQVKEDILYRPFHSLSGGERTKVLLAAMFLRENHFLLIDEPTNHLDLAGRQLLGKYLNQKKGFILVSHDRAFLDSCTDHMLSINRNDIQVQKGNFSTWFENRERQEAFELDRQRQLKKDISHLKEAARQTRNWGDQVEASKIGCGSGKYEKNMGARRAYIGEKSRRMQQRRKNLERRQERAIEEKEGLLKNVETAQPLKLCPLTYHKEALVTARDLEIGYGGQTIRGPVSFQVTRGSQVMLVGKNGCGKSSVIKAILEKAGSGARGDSGEWEGALRPEVTGGLLETGSGLKLSYISQETSHLRGRLEEYASRWEVEEALMKALLRKLDFSREQFARPLECLSEGQKKKVLIARSLCQQAHLYIWDEPLNYIDIYSRMQIEELIKTWKPTLLCVEHDSAFGEAIGAMLVSL